MSENKIPKYEVGSIVKVYSYSAGVTFVAQVVKIKKTLFGDYKYLIEWEEPSQRSIRNKTDKLAAWWSEKNIINKQ